MLNVLIEVIFTMFLLSHMRGVLYPYRGPIQVINTERIQDLLAIPDTKALTMQEKLAVTHGTHRVPQRTLRTVNSLQIGTECLP